MISAPQNHSSESSLEQFKSRIEFANATLPFLRLVVAEIVSLSSEHNSIRSRLEQMKGHRQLEGGEDLYSAEIRDIESAADRLCDRLKVCYRELDQIDGIRFSPSDPNAIDFLCSLEEGDLCFCWMLGEEAVNFWHWSDETCATRRPIDDFETLDQPIGTMLA